MSETAQQAHRQLSPSAYLCQFCIKRAIVQQGGLYLCADHAQTEEEIIELVNTLEEDLMPESVFDELYSGFGREGSLS